MRPLDRRAALSLLAAVGLGGPVLAAEDVRLTPAVTGPLSDFIAGAARAEWPAEVLDLGKRHILDTLAAITVCHDLHPAEVARRYALSQGPGGAISILGGPERADLNEAVFANAMAGHAAEINDFSPSAYVQPGPPVVSAAIGLAQARGLSGKAVLHAVVAGYELACRVPKALGLRNLYRSGLANHGIGPTFGAAAASASLIGLPQERIGDVLSYCAQQASGSWQWLLDTDHIEKAFVFSGMGARNGLQAALMVEAGFTGVPDALDRKGGWLDGGVFNGPESDLNRAYLIEDLGRRFELPLVGYKRYPSGGPTQAGVQCLLQLVANLPDRRAVEHVLIEMPGDVTAFRTAAMPALNLPYLAALIVADGRLDFQSAQSKARMTGDPAIAALMRRVEIRRDPAQERVPRVESARVTLRLADGSTHAAFVEHVPGFPAHPMSRDDVETKALELLAPRIGPARARRVIEQVWSLEDQPDLGPLLELLTA